MKPLAILSGGSHYSIFDESKSLLKFAHLATIDQKNEFLWTIDWLKTILN